MGNRSVSIHGVAIGDPRRFSLMQFGMVSSMQDPFCSRVSHKSRSWLPKVRATRMPVSPPGRKARVPATTFFNGAS